MALEPQLTGFQWFAMEVSGWDLMRCENEVFLALLCQWRACAVSLPTVNLNMWPYKRR